LEIPFPTPNSKIIKYKEVQDEKKGVKRNNPESREEVVGGN